MVLDSEKQRVTLACQSFRKNHSVPAMKSDKRAHVAVLPCVISVNFFERARSFGRKLVSFETTSGRASRKLFRRTDAADKYRRFLQPLRAEPHVTERLRRVHVAVTLGCYNSGQGGEFMNRFAALAIAVVAIALAGTAHAQFETATVLGTVRDASNAVVPEASVTLTNTATGVSSARTTNAEGNYEFFTVSAGIVPVDCREDRLRDGDDRKHHRAGRIAASRRCGDERRAGERASAGDRHRAAHRNGHERPRADHHRRPDARASAERPRVLCRWRCSPRACACRRSTTIRPARRAKGRSTSTDSAARSITS